MNPSTATALPAGWTCVTLGQVVEPRAGKESPASCPESRFIGLEHIEPHTMRLLATVPATSMKSTANKFEAGDVLYGRLRSYLNKVFQPDFAGLCSGEFIVIPESSAMRSAFLRYRLNATDFVHFASHITTGDRPRVDFEQLKAFQFWLPPLREQERIADTLDELLSDLDAARDTLERIKGKLSLYRAAILRAAVEGSLTADWRAKNRHTESASELLTRILAERRQHWEEEQLRKFREAGRQPSRNWKSKYVEPDPVDEAEQHSLPTGWRWVTLDALIKAGP